MKLGDGPAREKGLIASGITVAVPFEDQHWAEGRENDYALYVELEFDALNVRPFVSLTELHESLPRLNWTPQSSGIEIPVEIASGLEQRWATVPSTFLPLSEEVSTGRRFVEGAVRTVLVNSFERSRAARDACLAHHGTSCLACGTDFGQMYGPLATGYIHVHHHVNISHIGEDYEVNPVSDLCPLCPNCHAVAHLNDPPYTIEEIRQMIQNRRRNSGRTSQ